MLDELHVWMRLHGATSARVGDVALTLGPPIVPLAPPPTAEAEKESEQARERYDLETLLHSSGGDAEMFMSRSPRQ
jgi:hypothetical protein